VPVTRGACAAGSISSPRDTARSDRSIVSVCRPKANHRDIAVFTSAPEVRVLFSAGATRLHRSYDPVPPTSPSKTAIEAATLMPNGSPPITRITVPACRAHYPGGSNGCARRLLPIRAAFPVLQAGRRLRLYFRGLLRLHSRYGPSDCSTARGDLRHEASARPGTRPDRSSATRAIDNSPIVGSVKKNATSNVEQAIAIRTCCACGAGLRSGSCSGS
jgi:hypothetical protein